AFGRIDPSKDGDVGANGRVKIGLRARPVGAEEPVAAVAGDRHRLDACTAEVTTHLLDAHSGVRQLDPLREIIVEPKGPDGGDVEVEYDDSAPNAAQFP